jgi:IS5 family transposase
MKRIKNSNMMQPGFSSYDVERRSAKTSTFYNRINKLIDWFQIEKEINRYYKKGDTLSGAKPYSGLLLFKMLLLEIWNDLSAVQVEMHVNDRLSAMRFCGLSLEDTVPAHSTLSRFRSELTATGAMDKLLSAINAELSKHQVTVKHGVKVDAGLTESPRRPKITYEIAEEREEDRLSEAEKGRQAAILKKQQGKGVDAEGRWLKKGGRSVFGFKHHDAVDDNGLIPAVHTTPAKSGSADGKLAISDCERPIPNTSYRL